MKINKRNIGAILLIVVLTIGIVATGSQTKQTQESQCYFLIEYHTDPNYKSAKIEVPCDSFHNITAASDDNSGRIVWTVTPR